MKRVARCTDTRVAGSRMSGRSYRRSFVRLAMYRDRSHRNGGIDVFSQTVSPGDYPDVTMKEFDLLLHFAQHPGRVYARSQLLDYVWGYSHEGYEHTVNSHINRLRSKIEEDPAQPRYILTVWGVGYKFADFSREGD